MKNSKPYFVTIYILFTIFFLVVAFARVALFTSLFNSCLFTVSFAILTFILILINRVNIFSFPIIFLTITFLFTCSTPILYMLFGMQGFSEWMFLDLDQTNKALVVVNLIYSSFYLGVCLRKVPMLPKKDSEEFQLMLKKKSIPFDLAALRIIGFCLLALSALFVFIPTLQGKGLMTFIEYSYHEYHTERTEGEVDLLFKLAFSNFIPYSLILITLGAKSLKQFRNFIIIFVLPFIGIIFLTGDRSSAFPIILLLFSIFYFKFYKITKIPWRKLIIISLIAVYLIPVLRVTRQIPIQDWNLSTLIDVFTFKENNFKTTDTQDLNVVTSTLYSVSNSLQNLVGTMKLVPDKFSYRFGFDYFVRPVIVAIPFYNLFVDLDFRTRRNSIWVPPGQWSSFFYNRNGTGLGYLQVAEAYLNFGFFGVVIFYILAGYLLTKFWFNAVSFKNFSLKQLALWLLFLDNVFDWVRDDATSQLNYLLWCWIIVYGGFYLIDSFYVKKKRAVKISFKQANA